MADGTLSRYKARLLANGSTQLEGVVVDETFSLVVKPGTIRTILRLAAPRHCPIHQLVVKNAFLHGDLSNTKKYALEILDRVHMANCNPSRTPTDSESKLRSDGDPISDPTLYLKVLYSTSLLLDQIFFMQFSRLWAAAVFILYYRFDAEYRSVANAIAETCWLRNLVRELHTLLSSATLVYCDNVIAAGQVQSLCSFKISVCRHFYQRPTFCLFEEFRTSLSIQCPPALTLGECYPVILSII
ncbi:ribonuclease H-like domain-containing protein [Tanacetum coccineum]